MKKIFLIILCVLILNTFSFSTDDSPEAFEARYYDNAKLLRVKFVEGEAFVRRSYDEGYEEAAINLPVFEKDTVGTTEGRLELYLGRLNYLRLDYDTEVEFDRVPELRKTNTALRIKKGGIYLDIANLDFERDIEIQTPDCGVFLLDKGLYRINVGDGGATEVYVYEGIAEVSGDQYSRSVRENQKIVMFNGDVKERPFFFAAADSDGFDRWNKNRNTDAGYSRYTTSRYLSSGYEDYEYELSRSGRWVYNTSYREYIWIPYNIGVDWSPYYNGRWIWSPFYGYVWVSHDHWGYFTHHYGRWHWDSYYGWHWYPGYHWSPAWVYWFWDDHHYGWCPLSRWNRPVIIINKHWMRNYDYRHGIPIHSRATVIIKKNHLTSSHIRNVAIKKSLIKQDKFTSRGYAPKDRPSYEKIKVINARGKTVEYKNNGFRPGKKYDSVDSNTGVSNVKKDTIYKYKLAGDRNSAKNAYKYSKNTDTKSTTVKGYEDVKRKTYSGDTSRDNKSSTVSKDKYRSTETKYRSKSSSKSSTKSSSSSRSSSSGKSTKVKKEKNEPSYSSRSYSPGSSSSYDRNGSNSSSSYRSSYRSSYGDYKSSSSYGDRSDSRSNSYRPSTRYQSRGSVSSSSSSSYRSYQPSTRDNYRTSGSSSSDSRGSYSRPSYKSSSGSSSKSYSNSGSYSSPRSSGYSGSSRSYSGGSGRSSGSYSHSSSRSSSSSSSRSSSSSHSSRSSSSHSSSVKSSKKS